MRKLGVWWFSFVVLLVALLAVGGIALFVGVNPGTGGQASPWRELWQAAPRWAFLLCICGALVYGLSRKMEKQRLTQWLALVGGLGLVGVGWVWWTRPESGRRVREVAAWVVQVGGKAEVGEWIGRDPETGTPQYRLRLIKSRDDWHQGRHVGSIDLGGTGVTDANLASLERLWSLRTLILRRTRVTDAGLAHLERLQGVDWWDSLKRLRLVRQWSNLRWLDLSETPVTDAGLVHLIELPNLDYLNLQGTQVTDGGVAHIPELDPLMSLDLSGTQVTDAGLAHIRELDHLRSLDLSGTQVTNAGLAHLQALTYLHSLDLSGTRVTDAGLAHLQALDNLRSLDLSGTRVTDAGLAHLQALDNLRSLHLSGTRVTDAGARNLERAIPGVNVTRGSPVRGPRE